MNIKTLGAAVLAGAMVAGCGEKEGEAKKAEADSVAVTVNGKTLMKSKILADVEAVMKAKEGELPEGQRAYFRQLVENKVVQSFVVENVLVAKAKAEGYVVTDADRKVRGAEFMKELANVPNAPKTMEEFFKNYPFGEERGRKEFDDDILVGKMVKGQRAKMPAKDFTAEAKKKVEEIVARNATVAKSETEALAKIKSLKAELDKADDVPAKFAELAKANSACSSSTSGGDLGEFKRGKMVKEFEEAAFTLPVGKVSDPVKTQFGYHLLLVTGKTPAVEAKDDRPAAPEKVRASHILVSAESVQPVPKVEEEAERLRSQEESLFIREFVKRLLGEATIEASEEYKRFLPPAARKPAAKPAEAAPVEKPAAK